MTTTEVVVEEILLPWDAVPSKATQENYLRLSRWFLEFGGFIDPAAIRHKPGPWAAKALERQATKEGMVRMARELRRDPQAARTMVVQFIRKVNERIDAGQVADSWLEFVLKPVRLAFELNEIPVPWKKYARLIDLLVERGIIAPKADLKGEFTEAARHSQLRSLLNPMREEWNFVTVEASGRRSEVTMTDQGETALKIFGAVETGINARRRSE